MENNCYDLELEEKLLNNSLLFSSIRKSKTTASKITKIKKYLDRGADINTTDANDNNNTPLHVAVMKEEPEVVSFLLTRGAHVYIKNSESQTALDIALLLHKSTRKRDGIITILKTLNENKLTPVFEQRSLLIEQVQSTKMIEDSKTLQSVAYDITYQTTSQIGNNVTTIKPTEQVQSMSEQQQLSKELKKMNENKAFRYQKRIGTSGLSGQLYETKLLCLILFRALYVHKVPHFLIATNAEGMGAFDDIVFRFISNKSNKTKIIFLQAKHRDNPAKDKFTIDEIMKLNGDFSLHKYLESYIKISQMFVPENSDEMFRGEFRNLECEFVIYTPAFENFSKMKPVKETEGERFINTSEGKVFQFDYDDQDIKLLTHTVAKSRAVLLAKRLSKFIFKNNHNDMMMDDLIKTYHVFLARHILVVEIQGSKSQNNFHIAKFRESFFTSNDDLMLAFKNMIFQERKKYITSSEEKTEIENILISSSFKVPLDFGNLDFGFSGSEKRKEKEVRNLCSKFKQLYAKANVTENIMMKVNDSVAAPNEISQSTDTEIHTLGGLVGNLLVLDDETHALKFNSEIHTLSDHSRKLFEILKSEIFIGIDVSKCRFDINVYRFPRLSLVHNKFDKRLIERFLGNLTFFTNQAKEAEVERILKRDIDKYFVDSIPKQNDSLFRVKGDAVFLKVHDRVQKWWQQPITAPYLTKSCKYFFEAGKDILNSPLLTILNFNYTKTIKNTLAALKFKNTALETLHLDDFFARPNSILNIITEENTLSSMKIMQYLQQQNINSYTFIDLDYIGIGNYFVDVKSEVKESKINTLIVVCENEDLLAEIYLLVKNFHGKIIIICNRHLAIRIDGLAIDNTVVKHDDQTEFNDLIDAMQTSLLEDRYIMFQGEEVPLGILFEDKSYHLINTNVFYKILNNEKIEIGNCFNNSAYDQMSDIYINTRICRYITLDPHVRETNDIKMLKHKELESDLTRDTRDIVLVTDKVEEFEECIDIHKNCNVHWFTSDEEYLVWRKSRGNLLNILKHIHRGAHDAFTLKPVTLKDLRERVVIIGGEPGMGKSSLLTHLAINTKHDHPTLWISKINLLEYAYELKRMKGNKNGIELIEAVQFLFRVIGFKAFEERKADVETIIGKVSVVGDDISFNQNVEETNLTGLNLFEIELFVHCFNNDRVVLLFDGFDEICPDFANEFIKLVNVLKKSKVLHLWITSRLYNVLNQLENSLETFSFTILPLRIREQVSFLRSILLKNFGPNILDNYPVNSGTYRDCVEKFYEEIGKVVNKDQCQFLSVPLHLYMISEFFQDSFFDNSFNPRCVNLSNIYERFVNDKFFKIRFGEKKPLLCINDPDMRKLIDNERLDFLNVHKIIAAYLIFGNSGEIKLFDSYETNAFRDFIEKIKVGEEKTGIIEQIIQNKPKFFHYTFAEYFAAGFLYDKLKSFYHRSSLWKYLIKLFLQSERTGPLCFFNAKLGYHPNMLREIHSADLNEMFEALLRERQTLAKALFKLIKNRLQNIAIILLKFVEAVLNQRNFNDFMNVLTNSYDERCIVCNAVTYGAKNVVSLIIELVKNIESKRLIDLFKCSDLPASNPLAVPAGLRYELCEDVEWLDVLLSDLTPPDLVDLFCQQLTCSDDFMSRFSLHGIALKKIIHVFLDSWLQGKIDTEWFYKILGTFDSGQLMTILNARDSLKQTAAHIAAIKQSFTLFDKLEFLLDESQFKEICMARDIFGLTPIHRFHERRSREKLKELFVKVYDDHSKEEFVSRSELIKRKALIEYYVKQHKKN